MKSILTRAILIAFAVSLLVVITACSVFGPAFKGNLVKPIAAAPEINLTDDHGNNFQLSAQQGKVVLVFFGFTNCVDECPLTMAKLKQTLDSLGAKSQDVQVVMVSTDPVRDSSQALQDFLGKFNSDFLGIPGNMDQLKPIWSNYGVTVLDGGETHSSYVYAIDKKGDLRLTLDADLTPDDIAHDLNILLAEN
jgi:protein SCO1/2